MDGCRCLPWDPKSAPVSLQLRDCGGLREVEVTACLVWKDWPHRVHPHSLVGKDCTDGVCRVRLRPHVSPRHRYSTPDPQPFTPGHGDAQGDLRARGRWAKFSPTAFPGREDQGQAWGWWRGVPKPGPLLHTPSHTLVFIPILSRWKLRLGGVNEPRQPMAEQGFDSRPDLSARSFFLSLIIYTFLIHFLKRFRKTVQ